MKPLDLIRPAVILLALAACSIRPPGEPPVVPAIRAERIPVAPESRITQIWQPGHWDWDGQDYRWAAGEWVARSGHGPLWQDGYWRPSGRDFAWVPAHWL